MSRHEEGPAGQTRWVAYNNQTRQESDHVNGLAFLGLLAVIIGIVGVVLLWKSRNQSGS